MSAQASMDVGVVVERRETGNEWQPLSWRPVGIIAHARPQDGAWTLLGEGDGWSQFHAATMPIELFARETEGYCNNLSQQPPLVYVVLREGEDDDEEEMTVFHATVCPYEAMGYAESGDEIVEGVPMPAPVLAWVQEFVAVHHVEEPFLKRKNKRARGGEKGSRPRGKFSRMGKGA